MLINLTPHPITIKQDKISVAIEPSGKVARVATVATPSRINGYMSVIVQAVSFGEVIDLPEEKEGAYYVVSGMVLSALREQGSQRIDVVAPATGPNDGAIRDKNGHIVAVTKFNALI